MPSVSWDCTYTTQKTQKRKRWLDGHIIDNGTKVVLFSEEGRELGE
ncbi:hypothetical protein KIPB_016129, partial [Kipferlia bialata]|eukprot:g16129.t1